MQQTINGIEFEFVDERSRIDDLQNQYDVLLMRLRYLERVLMEAGRVTRPKLRQARDR